MFSYYGSKCKLAKFYPVPQYDLIIEPFAGAAWYSVLHRNKNVLLNENYEVIYNIWKWLIEKADKEIILNNLDFFVGQNINELGLVQQHKDLGNYIHVGTNHIS